MLQDVEHIFDSSRVNQLMTPANINQDFQPQAPSESNDTCHELELLLTTVFQLFLFSNETFLSPIPIHLIQLSVKLIRLQFLSFCLELVYSDVDLVQLICSIQLSLDLSAFCIIFMNSIIERLKILLHLDDLFSFFFFRQLIESLIGRVDHHYFSRLLISIKLFEFLQLKIKEVEGSINASISQGNELRVGHDARATNRGNSLHISDRIDQSSQCVALQLLQALPQSWSIHEWIPKSVDTGCKDRQQRIHRHYFLQPPRNEVQNQANGLCLNIGTQWIN